MSELTSKQEKPIKNIAREETIRRNAVSKKSSITLILQSILNMAATLHDKSRQKKLLPRNAKYIAN